MNKNKNITKAIIIVFIILAQIVSVIYFVYNSGIISEEYNKSLVVKTMLTFIFYLSIVGKHSNQKNEKYLKLPIKHTMGKRVGKIRHVSSGSPTDGLLMDGYQSAKYSFEIDGKKYVKKIFFGENEFLQDEMLFNYRLGKKDITNRENPKIKTGLSGLGLLFSIICTILTYVYILK
jgi:hypothetical protein